MSLISREAAIEVIKDPVVKGFVMYALKSVPAVPAVPLEPLAKWIAENLDPRCGCSYCSRDRVCCDCPTMTEQQVKEELTKWMEEQNESN